jgi:S1-C subfamily serine protease
MKILIGRSPECDVVVLSDAVSLRHAAIEIEGRQADIFDLGSTNGTFVNGERINRKVLEIGDRIRLGDTDYVWTGIELKKFSSFENYQPGVQPGKNKKSLPFSLKSPRFYVGGLIVFSMIALLVILVLGRSSTNEISANELARRTVFIRVSDSQDEPCWTGSGAVVLDGSYVLTNDHVASPGEDSECTRIEVGIVEDIELKPRKFYNATIIQKSEANDLALLRINLDGDEKLNPFSLGDQNLGLDVPIRVIGFPGIGGGTITLTNGVTSGVDNSESATFYKVSATINSGNSGGPVVDREGNLVAIATAVNRASVDCDPDCYADGTAIGLVRPIKYAVPLLNSVKTD